MSLVGIARDRTEFGRLLSGEALSRASVYESCLLEANSAKEFTVNGFCVPCARDVAFEVDMNWGGAMVGGQWVPNWRERLQCPVCNMNNRQRLIATLIKAELESGHPARKKVYLTERVTPIFHWTARTFSRHDVRGSEYLGHEYRSGTVVSGVCHQDVRGLSFEDDSIDLIVSNDVFEHVPDPARAFSECARVLVPHGTMLATIPFHSDKNASSTRAELTDKGVHHILPPAYHGNPVSPDGSLVFTDFGWDVLEALRGAGFAQAEIGVYTSVRHGHLGGGQLVFRMVK